MLGPAEEAMTLKDEIDILRHTADKVVGFIFKIVCPLYAHMFLSTFHSCIDASNPSNKCLTIKSKLVVVIAL